MVWLDESAHTTLRAHAIVRRRQETGGPLLGYQDGEDTVIACAYGPGPRARHRATTFEPHRPTTQAVIDVVAAHSDGRYRFLGSWHTHPGGSPRPSSTDLASLESIASETEVGVPRPIMLIQATRAGRHEVIAEDLRAWIWDPQEQWAMPASLRITKLEATYCPVVQVPRSGRCKPAALRPDGPDVSP
ncbi:MAG: hypothetical protein JWM93_1467 [Frankiales bacterium]|nr:hypothetical protein [Frankiales bacterium]